MGPSRGLQRSNPHGRFDERKLELVVCDAVVLVVSANLRFQLYVLALTQTLGSSIARPFRLVYWLPRRCIGIWEGLVEVERKRHGACGDNDFGSIVSCGGFFFEFSPTYIRSASRLIKTLPVPFGTLDRERVRMKLAAF